MDYLFAAKHTKYFVIYKNHRRAIYFKTANAYVEEQNTPIRLLNDATLCERTRFPKKRPVIFVWFYPANS